MYVYEYIHTYISLFLSYPSCALVPTPFVFLSLTHFHPHTHSHSHIRVLTHTKVIQIEKDF